MPRPVVAHINRIGTAVPAHDIHLPFLAYARNLLKDPRRLALFDRMAERSGISHRFSHMRGGDLAAGQVDAGGFFTPGRFPGTAARMAAFEVESLPLARRAIDALDIDLSRITHLVVATCTGFAAPGLDVRIALALGLRADVQRTLVGFMGCAAAVPALRIAAAAVVADQAARVLVVNLEICSLHLQESDDLTTVLSYLLWGDGCAASLVSADAEGLALGDFRAAIIPDSAGLITWKIGDSGFLMHLSGQVPMRIAQTLLQERRRNEPAGLLRGEGAQAVDLWAVHAGGRTVLDAVEAGLGLGPAALDASRAVLDEHGNMSSATVMFVLRRLLREAKAGARGLAMAFGPGMVAETFRFRAA